jgi:hypothetical protein
MSLTSIKTTQSSKQSSTNSEQVARSTVARLSVINRWLLPEQMEHIDEDLNSRILFEHLLWFSENFLMDLSI